MQRSLLHLFLGILIVGAHPGAACEAALLGWYVTGSHPSRYEIGVDRKVVHGGKSSGSIQAKPRVPKGFVALGQKLHADAYRGKRVRLSGYVKAHGIEDAAGLWMRIDGRRRMLALDNMMDQRRITGTRDWKQYAIVLDVPEQSQFIHYGITLGGAGQVWFDDFRFEVVSERVPTTRINEAEAHESEVEDPEEYEQGPFLVLMRPRNLDFEEPDAATPPSR